MEEFLLFSKPEHHVTFVVNRIVAAFMRFLSDHLVGMSLWFVMLAFDTNKYDHAIVPSGALLFALIPYWIYFAHKMIKSVRRLNQSKENAIFVPIFERDLPLPFLFLPIWRLPFYSLDKHLLPNSIRPSQTPRILLAMYSVVARVLIPILLFQAFSIGREEVVGLLPKRGLFWQYVADKLNKFYYLF